MNAAFRSRKCARKKNESKGGENKKTTNIKSQIIAQKEGGRRLKMESVEKEKALEWAEINVSERLKSRHVAAAARITD